MHKINDTDWLCDEDEWIKMMGYLTPEDREQAFHHIIVWDGDNIYFGDFLTRDEMIELKLKVL